MTSLLDDPTTHDRPAVDPVSVPETGWVTAASRVVYENQWIEVREDIAIRPDGVECLYGLIRPKHAGVMVVAFNDAGQVALITVDRYSLAARQVELPGGCVDEGEDPVVAGIRELREETGLVVTDAVEVAAMSVWKMPNPNTRVVVAHGARHVGGDSAVEDAITGYAFHTPAEIVTMMQNGTIADTETITSLMLAFLHTGTLHL